MTTPLDHLAALADVLDDLGVQWVLGGSMASSLRGEPRSTQDIDVAVEMAPSDVAGFVEQVRASYYAPLDMLIEAARDSDCANLLHLQTGFKIDLFFLGDSKLDRWQLERRERVEPAGLRRAIWVTSTPDIILRKLWWYRLGGEVSDRQWSDVVSVLRVQEGLIDLGALRRDARTVDLEDLLERSLEELR